MEYNESFDPKMIQTIGILSMKQYEKYRDIINPIDDAWWVHEDGDLLCGIAEKYANTEGGRFQTYGIRPVLSIINPFEYLEVGDRFKFKNYVWRMIDKDLALCDGIVMAANYGEFDIQHMLYMWLDK